MSARSNPPSFIVIDSVTGRVGYTKRATGVGNEAIAACATKAREIARKTGHSQIVFLELRKLYIGQELNVGVVRSMGITEEVHPDGSVTRNNPRRASVRPNIFTFNNPIVCYHCGKPISGRIVYSKVGPWTHLSKLAFHPNCYTASERAAAKELKPRGDRVRKNIFLFNNPRKLNDVEQAAANVGLVVGTWAPGDGVTRYRFFLSDGKSSYGDYHQGDPLYTALGRKDALTFLQAYGKGRAARTNPLTRKESADLLARARGVHQRSKQPTQTVAGKNYLRGVADGLNRAVSQYGPRGAQKVVGSMWARTAKSAIRSNPCGNPVVRGDKLPHHLQQEILNSFGYRWTKENEVRARSWFKAGNAKPPRIPLISDAQWLREHAFHVTRAGKLDLRHHHAEPYYMADDWKKGDPRPNPLLQTIFAANPLTRQESAQILNHARQDLRTASVFVPGHTRSQKSGQAFARGMVVKQYGGRSARRGAESVMNRAKKTVGTTFSNPGSVRLPKPGTRLTVAEALDLARRIGDRSLISQCQQALKLQKKANKNAKCVIWKTFAMGSKDKIDSVVALTHYGDSPETMYRPPKGSKKGPHMYRHKWGEGGGGKKTVPLLASADGKMLLMPLEGRKVASDWLRH